MANFQSLFDNFDSDHFAGITDQETGEYKSVTEFSDGYYKSSAEEDKAKTLNTRNQFCHFALRLSDPEIGSYGSATYLDKQIVSYGFVSEFTFQILHTSKKCAGVEYGEDKTQHYFCQQNYGSGFAFLIRNADLDLTVAS